MLCTNASANASVDSLCNYLVLANKFQLRALEEKCIQVASQKSDKSYRRQFNEEAKKYAVPFESQANVYRAMLDTQSNNIKVEMQKAINRSSCSKCYDDGIERLRDRIFQNHL